MLLLMHLRLLHLFQDRKGITVNSGLYIALRSIVRFVSSNANLYNTALFFSVLATIPRIFKMIFRNKDCTMLFLVSLVLSFLIQTVRSEDYVVRKFLVVYLILFIIIYILFISGNIKEFYSRIKTSKLVVRIIYSLFVIFSGVMCFCIPLYRLKIISDNTTLDFDRIDKYIVFISSVTSVAIALTAILVYLWIKKLNLNLIKGAIITACVIVFALNGYLDVKYIFTNKSYAEKQVMIDLGETVGESYVIGAFFPIGYTFYNEIKPVISNNRNIPKAIENNDSIFIWIMPMRKSKVMWTQFLMAVILI